MAEITITKPEDLKKFEGWTIRDFEMVTGLGAPIGHFIITVEHPAAEHQVSLIFHGSVTMQLSGTTVNAIPGVSLVVKDKE